MSQARVWDREYRAPQLVSLDTRPQSDVRHFFSFLKKEGVRLDRSTLLDLGSGTGRNTLYAAEQGARAIGIEIAASAIAIAKERTRKAGVNVLWHEASIGQKFPIENDAVDMVIDCMSSNSLTEKERAVYLTETQRVLKPNGYLFVRALLKDGDKHAQALLTKSGGREKDTYYMKELGLTERVFSEKDFRALYETHFTIKKIIKKSQYAKVHGRIYKRNYIILYASN